MIDADMQRFLKLDKDDFTGKAATLAQNNDDRTLQLIYFEVDAVDSDVRGNEPIFSGEQCVGLTTSGGFGHYTKKSLGFGYVPPALAAPGTELQVALLGRRCALTILADAAHDPANERLRA
jgi:dimethylglycine dehydrogenase